VPLTSGGAKAWGRALKTAREAVTHYGQLAEADPAAYLPNSRTPR
jgi:hypothetical protein